MSFLRFFDKHMASAGRSLQAPNIEPKELVALLAYAFVIIVFSSFSAGVLAVCFYLQYSVL